MADEKDLVLSELDGPTCHAVKVLLRRQTSEGYHSAIRDLLDALRDFAAADADGVPIEELELSTRTRNLLTGKEVSPIKTVGDVLRQTADDLLDIEGFGAVSLRELNGALVAQGYESVR